jgi:isopenicillin N synthase-like dioxygenase
MQRTGIACAVECFSRRHSQFQRCALIACQALKYPPQDGNTDAHTDYGCITLLLPGDEGLQVVGHSFYSL